MNFELNLSSSSSSSFSSNDDGADEQANESQVYEIRSALHFAVGKICRAEERAEAIHRNNRNNNNNNNDNDNNNNNNRNHSSNDESDESGEGDHNQSINDDPRTIMSQEAITALTDLTYHYATTLLSNDLVAFSNHANRRTVKVEDVLLAVRKDKNGIWGELQRHLNLADSNNDEGGVACGHVRVGGKAPHQKQSSRRQSKEGGNSKAKKKSGKNNSSKSSNARRKNKRMASFSASSSSSSSSESSGEELMARRLDLTPKRTANTTTTKLSPSLSASPKYSIPKKRPPRQNPNKTNENRYFAGGDDHASDSSSEVEFDFASSTLKTKTNGSEKGRHINNDASDKPVAFASNSIAASKPSKQSSPKRRDTRPNRRDKSSSLGGRKKSACTNSNLGKSNTPFADTDGSDDDDDSNDGILINQSSKRKTKDNKNYNNKTIPSKAVSSKNPNKSKTTRNKQSTRKANDKSRNSIDGGDLVDTDESDISSGGDKDKSLDAIVSSLKKERSDSMNEDNLVIDLADEDDDYDDEDDSF